MFEKKDLVMSERCKSCPDCEGCKEGVVYCYDTCFPYCPGEECMMPTEYDSVSLISYLTVIMMILILIVFLLIVEYEPS